jgi:hypothetical protein
MADILQKLFGSDARVKLLRLFLFNPRQSFTLEDATLRARVTTTEARREISVLRSAGVVESSYRGKLARYSANERFPYLLALQNLLLNAPARGEEIAGRLRGVGTIKLIVIGGIFLGEWDSSIDLFIVGDRFKEKKLRDRIRVLESEIGKELRFAFLTTDEFFYRLNMNDRLVRDTFDFPHRIIIDRLDIGLK